MANGDILKFERKEWFAMEPVPGKKEEYCEEHKNFSATPAFGKMVSVLIPRDGDFRQTLNPGDLFKHIKCPECRKRDEENYKFSGIFTIRLPPIKKKE